MLEILKIKNLAVIGSAEIHFKKGLNILSGETGAGKSIVIEAISLLLGSRASADLIRAGCEEASIEGIFQLSEMPWMSARLAEAGFEVSSTELLIKRIVHKAGKHRIFINGALGTLSVLQKLCEGLIDLCGQHEHQSLLSTSVQMALLDRYGGLTHQADELHQQWNQIRLLKKEQAALQKRLASETHRSDFLAFQIQEIRHAHLELHEDEQLQQEKQLLQSVQVRRQTAEAVRSLLEAQEDGSEASSVSLLLQMALQKIRQLTQLDPLTQPLLEGIERALVEIEEVLSALAQYIQRSELDPDRLQSVQDRLSLIANLKRKYGASIGVILETLNQFVSESESREDVEARLQTLVAEQTDLEQKLKKSALELHESRKKFSQLLSTAVTTELHDLNMTQAQFRVALPDALSDPDHSAHSSAPWDAIQFVVQTNLGEPERPLAKIASGGELSRLMLAIRRVIADRGGIGVYLFDEIDAGIGGQTAFQVGKKLKSVALYHQIICITHLPQIAAFAENHWVVRKGIEHTRTVTELIELSLVEQKEELARMLGGLQLTQRSLANASELLELATQSIAERPQAEEMHS